MTQQIKFSIPLSKYPISKSNITSSDLLSCQFSNTFNNALIGCTELQTCSTIYDLLYKNL